MNNFWKSFLCVLACIFLCVASFFTGYFFRDTVRIQQDSSLFAVSPADTVTSDYTYYGASFPLRVGAYDVLHDTDVYDDITSAVLSSNLYSSTYSNFRFYINRFVDSGRYIGFDYTSSSGYTNFNLVNLSTFNDYGVWKFSIAPIYGSKVMFYAYNLEQNFNFNVVRIEINGRTGFGGNTDIYMNNLYFYDNNGYSFKFEIVMSKLNEVADPYDYLPTYRTYYLTGDISSDSYYQQGYQTGFETGLNSGKQEGYTNGYNSGYQDGELSGYNDGVNSANRYTFSNLLTAVVEAPVNVFMNLLDFNIMGYNLLSLVIGLLTLAVVVLIVKLCLGGK